MSKELYLVSQYPEGCGPVEILEAGGRWVTREQLQELYYEFNYSYWDGYGDLLDSLFKGEP